MHVYLCHEDRSRPLDLTDPLISDPFPKTDPLVRFSFSCYFLLFSGSSSAWESSHWSQLAEALQWNFTQGLMGSLSIKNSWHLTPQHGGQKAWRALIGRTSLFFSPAINKNRPLSQLWELKRVHRLFLPGWTMCVWERDIYGTQVCNSVLMEINNLWKQILHIHTQLT